MKQTRTNDADPNPSSHTVDEMPALQYAIAVSDTLQQRRTRTLKHGDMFAVFDHRGDMGGEPGNSEGLYYRDTRMLSQFQLLLEEARPLLLSSMTQDDNAVFSADLSNPDLLVDGKIALRRENVHVNRIRFIWSGACYERLLVRNFSDRPLQLRLTYRFASDFADLFEVRGEHRAARGEARAALESDHGVALAYAGLDKIERSTHLAFLAVAQDLDHRARGVRAVAQAARDPPHFRALRSRPRGERLGRTALLPAHARRASGAARVERARREHRGLELRVQRDRAPLGVGSLHADHGHAARPLSVCRHPLVLHPLRTRRHHHRPHDPVGRSRPSPRACSSFSPTRRPPPVEPERDAEPGKILHEMRHGEMANLREVPFGRYYGSVDATPLFVLLLGEYFRRTGDLETVRSLWPNAQAALEWIDRYGDRDGDGFVEYYRQTKEGLANQGWKDSYDAIFHQDGRMAEGPIALCEVQAYVYGAKRHAATLAEALGHGERAAALAAQAEKLRQDFENASGARSCRCTRWRSTAPSSRAASSPRTPARCCSPASPPPSGRSASRSTLLAPSMFSGWGIRTVARRRRATTPCPITTARSGRTTTA